MPNVEAYLQQNTTLRRLHFLFKILSCCSSVNANNRRKTLQETQKVPAFTALTVGSFPSLHTFGFLPFVCRVCTV